MNFGLAAVLTVLSLTPGIFFREAYFSGIFSKRFIATRALQEFASILLYSLILHALFITLVSRYNVLPLGQFSTCLAEGDYQGVSFTLASNIRTVVNYVLFVNLWSLWLGLTSQKVIRFLKIDRRFPVFRFANNWHYLLSAEVIDFPSKFKSRWHLGSDVNDYIHVDILSDISGTSFLYSGKLFHYCLGKDGGLESITMIHPFRIKRENFDEGRTSEQFMMPITVDYLVFLHEHIINYNFTYLSLKKPRNRIMLLIKRLYRYFVHPAIAFVLLLLIWHKHDWFIEQIHLGLLRLL
jgi:hypothetical protein